MIRIKDRLKSFIYRALRSDAGNSYNLCSKCKAKRRSFADIFLFKKDVLIGYDKVLAEWVIFSEHNFYVKTWVMNGYIVKMYSLTEPLWNKLRTLCRKCISKELKTYKEENEV